MRDRFQLVLWDLPGLGESTPTGGHDYAMQTLAAWSRRDPGTPITLVLNSPGGRVLDGMAIAAPDVLANDAGTPAHRNTT